MKNKWIDQYFLRYAVGTVVGALVVACCYARLGTAIKQHVPQFDTWGKVTALTAAGLSFCYIASAPLLVFHMGRSRIFTKESRQPKWEFIAAFFVALVVLAAGLWLRTSIQVAFALAYAAAVLVAQIGTLIKIGAGRSSIYDYYKDLSRSRLKQPGLVESYRGLREHGNAYAILLFEAMLGILLIESADTIKDTTTALETVMGAIAVWVAPASLVLYSGTRVEADLVDDWRTRRGDGQAPSTASVGNSPGSVECTPSDHQ